jgi:hypothetical protein
MPSAIVSYVYSKVQRSETLLPVSFKHAEKPTSPSYDVKKYAVKSMAAPRQTTMVHDTSWAPQQTYSYGWVLYPLWNYNTITCQRYSAQQCKSISLFVL